MKYWSNRLFDEQQRLYDVSLHQFDRELAKRYNQTLRTLKRDIVSLYDELQIAAGDGTLLVSDLYKYNRYYELMNNINGELDKLGIKENDLFDDRLTNFYLNNAKLVGGSFGLTSTPNIAAVQDAVRSIWCSDGKMFSDRIWSNKALLANKLEQGLIDCVAAGASHDRLAAEIVNTFNVGFAQADRLARTELAYVQSKSTMDKYAEAGVEYVEIIDAGDERECDECASI